MVDDDPVTAMLITAILESSAYDVKSTESGETALDVLAIEQFDLLVTDLRMPGIGGIGLIQEIATRSILHLSRILVITGEHPGSAACRRIRHRTGNCTCVQNCQFDGASCWMP